MRFKKVIMTDVQYIHTFNKKIVKVMAIGNLLYYGVALPTWFYCTQQVWPYMTAECKTAWNILDLFNLIVLILYSGFFAVTTLVIISCVICNWKRTRDFDWLGQQSAQETAETAKGNRLTSILFDAGLFAQMK